MKKNKIKHADIYAEIATQRIACRDSNLIEPQPLEIPQRILPFDKMPEESSFQPSKKMTTAAELQIELEKQRKRYSKYFQNFAPKIESTRIIQPLGNFDWRIETDQDRKNFISTLSGKGKWERVQIPHYGAPLGKAVTYYRTSFEVTTDMLETGSLFVHFKGVDYKAHVFINGAFLDSHEGFFAPFEFEFTKHARLGENILFVKVENDFIFMGSRSDQSEERIEGDKLYAATGCGYDDPEIGWHHCPPGMGIYQDVFIEARTRLFIHDIFIRPILVENRAEAWIEIFNCDVEAREISLELSLFGQNFQGTIFEGMKYHPASIHVPGLGDVAKRTDHNIPLFMKHGINLLKIPIEIADPKIWKPDSPWLYQLQVKLFDENSTLMDISKQQFGMRSFEMDETKEPKGGLFLNGKQVKLRGANTMGHLQQCVIKKDWDQLRDDILLAKICNMNFLRLTQRPVQPEIYDDCDKLGMMTQTDLPLFGVLRRNQFCEAVRQAEEMERLVRKHPCNILVSYINEPFPNAMDEPHRHLVRAELEDFFKAADIVAKMANPDRVIKAVDGEYDPPAPGLPDNHCYCGWYNGHGLDLGKLHKGYWQKVKPGWFYGCGEFGSEGLDPLEVMQKYYPKEWLPQTSNEGKKWMPDRIVMAQTGKFHYFWFETPESLEEWVRSSQAHQEWVTRLMTEAFRRDRRMVSFAIHLFIDAFPSGWMKAIMDVDRQPKPAYFAYQDGLTPLMVSLRTDRWAYFSGEEIQIEAWICNDQITAPENAMLHYQVEMNKEILKAGKIKAKIPIGTSDCHGIIKFKAPDVHNRTKIVFRLGLIKGEKVLHDTELKVDIFKPIKKTTDQPIQIFGDQNGKAIQLAEELKIKNIFSHHIGATSIFLIDDFEKYLQFGTEIDQAVKNGALVVFIELPEGEYHIAGTEISVKKCGMGARHFVSRKTGHPLIKDFQPNDFKFWYDAKCDYPTPLLSTTFKAEGWNPILTSGDGDWQGNWRPTFAAAEKRDGRGIWRICQVYLSGRIQGNPVAEIFAERLLNTDRENSWIDEK